jgi:hypothetical protein
VYPSIRIEQKTTATAICYLVAEEVLDHGLEYSDPDGF